MNNNFYFDKLLHNVIKIILNCVLFLFNLSVLAWLVREGAHVPLQLSSTFQYKYTSQESVWHEEISLNQSTNWLKFGMFENVHANSEKSYYNYTSSAVNKLVYVLCLTITSDKLWTILFWLQKKMEVKRYERRKKEERIQLQ